MIFFKVCLVTGLVLSSPWAFYQVWAFIAAGLYRRERMFVYKFLPYSLGLFLAGVFLCFFVVLPLTLRFLLEFNVWLGVTPMLRLNDWMGFATVLPLVFGLCFQTPLVMLFLSIDRDLHSRGLSRKAPAGRPDHRRRGRNSDAGARCVEHAVPERPHASSLRIGDLARRELQASGCSMTLIRISRFS